MQLRFLAIFIVAGVLAGTGNLSGATRGVKGSSPASERLFPVSPRMHRQVWFWEKIFRDYSSRSAVIHDVWFPELIIDVVDITSLRPDLVLTEEKNLIEAERQALADSYLDRYRQALDKFSVAGENAVLFGSIERRIWEVYKDHPEGRERLLKGDVSIRSQRGLADKFLVAAGKARLYFPYMEKIFRSEGVPAELSRMVFVESMFQLDAWSKVGAAGLWQFMPATGRRFGLKVTGTIDERNSPLKATRAAALFLKNNFERLNSWPLAITSYNHGVNGMARAVRETGTFSLDEIILNYKSRSFGFASRNFYAEFIAAKNVYLGHAKESGLRKPGKDPLGILLLDLPDGVALSQLIRYTPLTETTLRQWNPCLLRGAWGRRSRFRPLPDGYSIVVPGKLARRISAGLKKIRL